LIDVPVPQPESGEVLVRIHAAGLNPVDWKIATGVAPGDLFGVSLPAGLGNDFAGVVEAVGSDVADFGVGDRVFGGAYAAGIAEHVVVPANGLHLTPSEVDDVTAGALPVAGATADAAVGAVHPQVGETVLIGGGAGGVGVFAVQLAVQAGAAVIATASEHNHEFLASLGATPTTYGEGLVDRVRDLAPSGVDAAIDLQGTATAEAAIELGVDPGRISTIAAGPNAPAGTISTGGANAEAGALDRIANGLADGELQLPVQQTFPLDQALDGLELLRQGHVRGKIVITI
jgi:NADPH:quinone reductase-like Zn-dependent oxidoreductase